MEIKAIHAYDTVTTPKRLEAINAWCWLRFARLKFENEGELSH